MALVQLAMMEHDRAPVAVGQSMLMLMEHGQDPDAAVVMLITGHGQDPDAAVVMATMGHG